MLYLARHTAGFFVVCCGVNAYHCVVIVLIRTMSYGVSSQDALVVLFFLLQFFVLKQQKAAVVGFLKKVVAFLLTDQYKLRNEVRTTHCCFNATFSS